MASYIKSKKGYIALCFVLYTVLVTYLLAQRAWDDVSNLLQRRNEVKFLDVLVQEERRHLRSFQDVVNNYRGDDQLKFDDKVSEREGQEYNLENKQPMQFHLGATTPGVSFYKYESEVHNVTYLPEDLKLQPEQEVQGNRPPRPVFQVEVEEWDENAVHSKQLHKTSSHSLELTTHSNSQDPNTENQIKNGYFNISNSKLIGSYQNAMQQQKSGNIFSDTTYTTAFCDNVYDVFGLQPTICKRELAETDSKLHINISSYSLLFRELGDIFIFSSFLDTRESSFFIRLMTLGRKGHDNSKSVYWCVFYLRSSVPSPNSKSASDLNTTQLNVRTNRHATQLIYYSASDGHNKNSQFYILSCPVPELAKASLLPPYRGLFQIIVGNIQAPFLNTRQESLALRVIRNKIVATPSEIRTEKGSNYFEKMEQELLILNVHKFTSNVSNSNNNISNNNNFNIRINKRSDTSQQNRSIYINVNKEASIERERLNVMNSSEDKIVSCVAPLQGSIGVVQLVEFIELTLLLGSQHIVFYAFQISDEIMKALYMYVGRGLVTVLPWNVPAPESMWANGRDVALNDCLYRTMHIYDYALFLDLDEFLVPRVTPDIPSFLKYLKAVHRFNSSRFSDLVFSSAYFPPSTKAQLKNLTSVAGFTRDVSKLVSLRNVHRTFFNPKHTLRLIKLSKAFRVGAGERKRTSFTISSRFAVVNHYSYCPPDTVAASKNSIVAKKGSREKNTDFCSRTKQDFIMWRYKSELIQRVKDSIRRLNR